MSENKIIKPGDPDWINLHRIRSRTSLIAYIRSVAPWFTVEEVHTIIAVHLEALADGELDRLMLFLPPRTGKSSMSSIFLPSWWSGRYPSDKILQVGHSVELSRGFSLSVREIMQSEEYQFIFPGVQLAKDAKAAGKFRIEDIGTAMERLEKQRPIRQQGQYNAAGVTSSIAGKGFNLGLPDDVMSEQDKDSKITKDRIWNWWGPGFYTRRQPERNAICLTMTRWAPDDLAGHLLEEMGKDRGADTWTVLNVPAILSGEKAKLIYSVAKEYGQISDLQELKAGGSFAPRRWTLKELARSKAQLTERDWEALYMGNPTLTEGHILKRKYWRLWPKDEMPICDFVFQQYDTAYTEEEQNDNSARTTWGLFPHLNPDGRKSMHMILLEGWERKVEAPDLKAFVMEGAWGSKEARAALVKQTPQGQETHYPEGLGEKKPAFHPDRINIENKASGIWLIRELRRINHPRKLPIWPWMAPRGGHGKEMNKYQKAIFGSLVLEQGSVWYPRMDWAEKLIDKCAECKFDGSDAHDDIQETVASAMIYVRQTYRVDLESDRDEEEEKRAGRKPVQRQFYGAR